MEQTTDRAAGTITAPALAIPRARGGVLVDLWIARVLVAAALGLVLLVGIRHALDQPIYGPIDEAYHAGYVQRVADTGLPPMLGRDEIFLAHRSRSVGGVVLPGPRAGTAPLPFGDHFQLSQEEAIQPPLYYYVVAPVAWFTRGSDKIYALRIASSVLNALGVLFLFLALRGTFRREPLAAGVAAVVLASFTGITDLLSQVQNDALLLPVCVLLLWAFIHDLQARRVSVWLGLAAGAAAATQLIAVPLGAAALVITAVHAAGGLPRKDQLRGLVVPFVAYVAPLSAWVLLNIDRYHYVIPRRPALASGTAATNTASELFGRTFELLRTAQETILETSYLPMWPSGGVDFRPAGLLMVVTFSALALVLWRLRPESRDIGLWVGIAVGAFLLTFFATMLNASRSGSTGEVSGIFVGRYFVATLAAISGAVGITVVSALAGYDTLRRLASVGTCAGLIYFSLTAAQII